MKKSKKLPDKVARFSLPDVEEQARARIRWDHNNFFGDARHAGLEAKWSSLDRGVRLNFNEPWFFTRHLSFSAQAQTWDERGFAYFIREVYDSFYPGYGESWPLFHSGRAN